MGNSNEILMEQQSPDSDMWTVVDARTRNTIKTTGYPTDQQILDFKRTLGYGTIRITEDNAGTRTLEFKPVDVSA